jgi:hypothetical protein
LHGHRDDQCSVVIKSELAAVAALIAAGACKSADPSSTPGPANTPSPIVATAAGEGTAVFWSSTMTGFLLGCATGEGITGDKAKCLAMIRSGDTVGDKYGRVLTAGESGKRTCSEQAGSTTFLTVTDVALPETYEGERVGHIDPMTELYVFPARRAADLVVAREGDDGELDRAAAAAILRGAIVRLEDDPAERTVAARPGVRSYLRTDLDGDGALDTVWGVEGRPDEEFGINGLFAELSRTGGLVALHLQMTEWQEPIAAIDLDGDGAAELIHTSHYASAETTTVSRIVDGALVPIGSCCCTEP